MRSPRPSTYNANTALEQRNETPSTVLTAALILGGIAVIQYYRLGLTLSHYDAKAHLVVARRIVDSLSPGWVQIGAVWLPLPHLLNLLPVQWDPMYRTGASAVAISWCAFAVGARSLWSLVMRTTGSRSAAWAAFAVLAAQPDLLYLQATPMTEPLLIGLCLLAADRVHQWTALRGTASAWPPGAALALACLTRYEAWPVAATAIVYTGYVLSHKGIGDTALLRSIGRLAAYPAAAIAGFMCLSHATVGAWLVTDGFFEPDATSQHHPIVALMRVGFGLLTLNGVVMTLLGGVAVVVIAHAIMRRGGSPLLLIFLVLAAAAALPWFGFWKGHPFRIRYMVPLTMPLATAVGIGIGLLGRYRYPVAATVIAIALLETPPFSAASPMVREAQWDIPHRIERSRVAACLTNAYDGTLILASMGSLAHFMQELSGNGFVIRNFIHEGNGRFWSESLVRPASHAGWMLIDELNEGGDVLARQARINPRFLDGFKRMCNGGGVTLYRLTRPLP